MSPVTYSPCPNCRKLNKVNLDRTVGQDPVCGSCGASLPVHGALSEVTASGLMTLVEKSPLPVIADFWASWCGPCKAFSPVFERIADQMAGEAVFVKVNTEENPMAGDMYAIRGIPTVVMFKNGAEKSRQSGAMPPDYFTQWVRENSH